MMENPCWTAPIELVQFAASATSLALLYRAQAKGARVHPTCLVFRRCGRLVAQVDFLVPIGPEKEPGLLLMLKAPLLENRDASA